MPQWLFKALQPDLDFACEAGEVFSYAVVPSQSVIAAERSGAYTQAAKSGARCPQAPLI